MQSACMSSYVNFSLSLRHSRCSRRHVAPSLLDLCGVAPPSNIHGRSWVNLARAGDRHWRKTWVYYYNDEKQFPYTPNVRAVRTESWKYIRHPYGHGKADRPAAELYNIEFDPGERINLAGHRKYAHVRDQMQGMLDDEMALRGLTRSKDRMPIDEGIKKVLPDAKIR